MFQRALLPLAALVALPAPAQDLAATLGKQRAASSAIEWQVREAGHPALGNIQFAYVKRPVETRVGNQTVFSRAYLSCQRDKRSFAIELANATAPADPGGLKPATDPRLICNRPTGDGKLAREEILATWQVNDKIGDALTRGLRAFPLRECSAITVQQEVVLPAGWTQKTARIEFEILPYNREVDSVFAACGERSAYAPGTSVPAVAAAAAPAASTAVPRSAAAAPRKAAPVAAAAPLDGWREARVVFGGKTNVRAGPSLQSRIVVSLHPGAVVQVQRTSNEWWRAKAHRGSGFEGYIREDRLLFR